MHMYIYTYADMYIYMHVNVYVYKYVYIDINIYIYACVRICVYVYTHIYAYVCIHIHIYICMYVCTCTIQYNGAQSHPGTGSSRRSSESTRDTGLIHLRITPKHSKQEKLQEQIIDYSYSTRLPLTYLTHLGVIFAL